MFSVGLLVALVGLASVRASLFSAAVSERVSERPVHLTASLHGTHSLTASLSEGVGQYVQTKGLSAHDDPIEWVWQRPVVAGRGHTLRGLVFLAHGCSHHSTDYFPPSNSCPKCIGLPEEVRMSGAFLRQQYAVVAVSSRGHCWNEEDFGRVNKVLSIVVSELGGGGRVSVPLYAVGASSGGSFVAHLPNVIPGFKAVVVQIMSVQGKSLLHSSGAGRESKGTNSYPPSLWIAMTNDERTLRSVQRTVKYLNEHKKIAELIEASELPLHATYFSDRITGMTPDISKSIVTTLNKCDLMDESDFLLQDPRMSEWRICLKKNKELWEVVTRVDTLEADLSPISEELNVAYAMHEITANYMSEIINFVMKYK